MIKVNNYRMKNYNCAKFINPPLIFFVLNNNADFLIG